MRTMVNLIKRQVKWILVTNILLIGIVFGQCTAKPAAVADLGNYPSFSIQNIYNVAKTQMPETGLNCNFKALLALLGTSDKIDVEMMSSEMILRHEKDPSVGMPFQLYADKELKEPINPHSKKSYNMGQLLDLLGLLGDGDKNMEIPMYIDILPIQNPGGLLAGRYISNVSLKWDWNICKGVSLLFICLGRDTGSAPTNLFIYVDIDRDCLISANDIYFGARSFVTEFEPVKGTITITCTKDTVYSVGLSEGDNAVSEGAKAISTQRHMRFGKETIAYEIYKGNGSSRDVWGKLNSQRRLSADADTNPGVGTGERERGQIYSYTAEIIPFQDDKPAGTYIDHVVIDIGF